MAKIQKMATWRYAFFGCCCCCSLDHISSTPATSFWKIIFCVLFNNGKKNMWMHDRAWVRRRKRVWRPWLMFGCSPSKNYSKVPISMGTFERPCVCELVQCVGLHFFSSLRRKLNAFRWAYVWNACHNSENEHQTRWADGQKNGRKGQCESFSFGRMQRSILWPKQLNT